MDKLKRKVYGWLVRGEDAAVGYTSIWADAMGGEYYCDNQVGLFDPYRTALLLMELVQAG